MNHFADALKRSLTTLVTPTTARTGRCSICAAWLVDHFDERNELKPCVFNCIWCFDDIESPQTPVWIAKEPYHPICAAQYEYELSKLR